MTNFMVTMSQWPKHHQNYCGCRSRQRQSKKSNDIYRIACPYLSGFPNAQRTYGERLPNKQKYWQTIAQKGEYSQLLEMLMNQCTNWRWSQFNAARCLRCCRPYRLHTGEEKKKEIKNTGKKAHVFWRWMINSEKC